MPAASLEALLAKSIDYAGMFPPCSLALEPALQNQAQLCAIIRSVDAQRIRSARRTIRCGDNNSFHSLILRIRSVSPRSDRKPWKCGRLS